MKVIYLIVLAGMVLGCSSPPPPVVMPTDKVRVMGADLEDQTGDDAMQQKKN